MIRRRIADCHLALSLAIIASVAGCGGGLESRKTPYWGTVDGSIRTYPDRSVTLTPSSASVPSADSTSRIDVTARFVIQSGSFTPASAPLISIYDLSGEVIVPNQAMKLSAAIADTWEMSVVVHATPPFRGIKMVAVTATDKDGNTISQPIGLLYYTGA